MAAKDDRGRAGEDRAARYLTARGYRILDRNWRTRGGEIDLVALDGDAVVFVEVKTRSSDGYGHPLEAIDARKRERLWRLAQAWRAEHPEPARGRRVRLDAVAIVGADPHEGSIEHVQDVW